MKSMQYLPSGKRSISLLLKIQMIIIYLYYALMMVTSSIICICFNEIVFIGQSGNVVSWNNDSGVTEELNDNFT